MTQPGDGSFLGSDLLEARGPRRLPGHLELGLDAPLWTWLGLALLDACALWFLYQLVQDGIWSLAVAVGFVTTGLNVVYLRRDTTPLRWLSPSLTLVSLLVIYPLVFTVYVAFTNYSNTHRLTKQQALRIFEMERFLPVGTGTYRWTAFRSPNGEYVIWLLAEDGRMLLARQGRPAQEATEVEAGVGTLDQGGVPESIDGYQRLTKVETVRAITELTKLKFGSPPDEFQISGLDRAAKYEQKYVYDIVEDTLIDRETGSLYYPRRGTFVSVAGEALPPSYQVAIGFDNFRRLIETPGIREPVVRVFLWTVVYALTVVVVQFAMGLSLALVLNDPIIPGRLTRMIRAVLLLPYVIPSFLTILAFKAMLNPHVGVINRILGSFGGFTPAWFSDPWAAKGAVLLVSFWLGFPYFLLICTGALQSISPEIQEAAEVDGASGWQRFWRITLPLLLTALGPLPIIAFAFNFNNFNSIFLLTEGGPPMMNAQTPAGHTDILISYTYKLAFGGGRDTDYGFASVITLIIYFSMLVIVLPQLRYARWIESSGR